MGFKSWLVEKEKRFAWSMAGTLLGVVSLLIAYVTLQEQIPNVELATISSVNVLDINTQSHTQVPDLNIEFQGANLQDRNLNLRILTVRIRNIGDTDILEGHYDSSIPWGFRVSSGRVIESRLTGSNSDYLRSSLNPQVRGDSILLNKTILERDKYATFEILVIHREDVEPRIQALGKIAGIDAISVVVHDQNQNTRSFYSKAFTGSIGVQLARVIGYLAVLIFVIALLIGVTQAVTSLRRKTQQFVRRRHLSEFRQKRANKTAYIALFTDLYIQQGSEALTSAETLLADTQLLREQVLVVVSHDRELTQLDDATIDSAVKGLDSGPRIANPSDPMAFEHDRAWGYYIGREYGIVIKLLKANAVSLKDTKTVHIDEDASNALKRIIKYLRISGRISLT